MQKFWDIYSVPQLILACVIVASFSLMLWASFEESAIMDELAHIPAGYGYVNNLDFRLNPEHPPLVKALAALPLLLVNPTFPTNNSAWTTAINGQWDMGTAFLYESGNSADLIIRVSRIFPILLTILLIILVYIWAVELMGAWWGLLPAVLTAFSPTILAHGHYVTTDVGATLGIFLSAYLFIKFILSPSKRNLLMAGLGFGLAQLMKFSAVLLIPYFIILLLFYFAYTVTRDWRETGESARLKRFSRRAAEYLRAVMAIFIIGYVVVVYPAYLLFTFNQPIQKQVSDTETILASFGNGPTPAGQFCKPARCLADLDIWMSKNHITRPFSEYMLGVLMVMQRASGGNTSYFLGQVSNTGSASYFPMVYLLKETLPTLIIIFFGLLLALMAIAKKFAGGVSRGIKYFFTDYLGNNFAEFSMLVFVILYWAYSMKSPLNIGVRHLLPTFPFIYVLAAGAWKKWLDDSLVTYETNSVFERIKIFFKSRAKFLARFTILFVLAIWFFVQTISGAPYFLSYFNESGGGTYGGYRYVTDSNYDWGQDLLRLQAFIEIHPEINKIAVDYFGGGKPSYYLGDKEVNWQSSKGSPVDSGIKWFAVSINTLQSAIEPLLPGQTRKPEDEYGWLVKARPYGQKLGEVPPPDYRVGTSIFVYKL